MPRRALLASALAWPLAMGCAGGPAPRGGGAPAGAAPGQAEDILPAGLASLVSRDWHSDIALAKEALTGRLAQLAAATWPDASHLVFGFGDRAWLLDPDRRAFPAMLLSLLPGPGAMIVTPLPGPPAQSPGAAAVLALPLTAAGLRALHGFIEDSFAWSAAGAARRLDAGEATAARFFASGLTYSAAFTCNTWTAEALMRAGLPVRPTGVVLAGQVEARARAAVAAE